MQLYLLIVVSYLNLFPTIDQLLAFQPAAAFTQAQFIAIVFFELPLCLFLKTREKEIRSQNLSDVKQRLRGGAPVLLLVLLAIFWIIAIQYDQFFVRLNYDAFLDNPNSVPSFFLYPYRLAVESSYFVILYLIFSLHFSTPQSKHRVAYQVTLTLYLFTFVTFFFINSRMQFLLLMLSLYFVRPSQAVFKVNLLKLMAIAAFGVMLIVLLTLIRELYIESNNRLDARDLLTLLGDVSSLIAGRLNSLDMLSRSIEVGYNPFGIQMDGLLHVFNMYFSFITDPVEYAKIRASEITSPSVVIVNNLLSANYVDFPKSTILDFQLSFGAFSLPMLAWILSVCIKYAQRTVNSSHRITRALLFALFITPLLLQFEKESFGLFSFVLKWSPILVLLMLLYPRQRLAQKAKTQVASPLQLTATPSQNS